MRYRILILMILLSLHIGALGKNQIPEQNKIGFAIEAHIKGLPDGVKTYLLHRNNQTMKVDTAGVCITANGTFRFKGEVDQSAKFYTILFDKSSLSLKAKKENYIMLLLDNSNITINGSIDSWPEVTINGSKAANDYIEYLDIFSIKFDDLRKYKDSLEKQIEQARQNLESEKADNVIDSLKNKYIEAELNYNAAYVSYIEAHPDSYLTPFAIMQNENQLGIEKLSLEYEKLSARVKASLYGTQLKARIDELNMINEKLGKKDVGLEVGKIVPDFTAQTFKGKQVSLYDICKGGKITLLDFWASWCKPCRAAFPDLKELYRKYHDKGFNVVSLSTDKDLKTWKEASDTDKLPWYDLSDVKAGKSFAEELYKIFKLPTTYLLDTNGKIIDIDVDKKKLEEILEELLK